MMIKITIKHVDYAYPCASKPKSPHIKVGSVYVEVGQRWEVTVSETRCGVHYISFDMFLCKPTRKQVRRLVKSLRSNND